MGAWGTGKKVEGKGHQEPTGVMGSLSTNQGGTGWEGTILLFVCS